MKRSYLFTLCMVLLFLPNVSFAQKVLSGFVLSAQNGQPLEAASITVYPSGRVMVTGKDGAFKVLPADGVDSIRVSSVGFIPSAISGIDLLKTPLNIYLEVSTSSLSEVVINTGYYKLPKERATGSFEYIDNGLFNRGVGADVLSRLDNMAAGVQFITPGGSNPSDIRIRGLSTIQSDETPLIILDNFPYEGDIASINPNDVESVTVLKDAAAASIWGARAGNGVLVITTKQGRYGRKTNVSASANTTVSDEPDFFYSQNRLPSETVMQIEKAIYENDGYSFSNESPLPAYVELLHAYENGSISREKFKSTEALYAQTDIRNEAASFLYRPSVHQQYHASASGGGEVYRFNISAGLDRTGALRIGDDNQRHTLNIFNALKPSKRIEVGVGLRYTAQSATRNGLSLSDISLNSTVTNQYMPFAGHSGHPLPVVKDHSLSYIAGVDSLGLLDWSYRPLDELKLNDSRSMSEMLLLNSELSIQVNDGVKFSGQYQYSKGSGSGYVSHKAESYYARNIVNKFTQADGSRIVPEGGVFVGSPNTNSITHSVRPQLDVNYVFGNHAIDGLAGGELRSSVANTYPGYTIYRYDDDLLTGTGLFNFSTIYPTRPSGVSRVPVSNAIRREFTDRFLSYFGNVAYSYKDQYLLTGSLRWDGSNLFGVKTNQKGAALWSVGGSWNLDRNDYYGLDFLSMMKLRLTYGHSGNVNKGVSHYPLIRYDTNTRSGLPAAIVTSIGNPSLRWERIQTLNIGLDYALKGNWISGSVDYYIKQGRDLIGNVYMAPSTGVLGEHLINYADLKTVGIDMKFSTRLSANDFTWRSHWLASYVSNEVTDYETPELDGVSYYITGTPPPVIGRSRDAIYALPWNGLDGTTGLPVFYIDGVQSDDYAGYYNSRTPEDIELMGTSIPKFYGSMRHEFSWKNLSLSFLIQFKLGYKFRRNSISSGDEFYGVYHMDYLRRWKKPGDERYTDVPRAVANGHTKPLQSAAYLYSAALIESGNHIRFNDLRLDYTFHTPGRFVKSFSLFGYAKHLGLLWKANDAGVDPDYPSAEFTPPTTYTIGINTGF